MSISETSKFNINLQDNCTICLVSFKEDGDALVRGKCGHVFHKNCIEKWGATPGGTGTCPLCRGPLNTAQYIKPNTNEQVAHVHSTVIPYIAVPGSLPNLPGAQNHELDAEMDLNALLYVDGLDDGPEEDFAAPVINNEPEEDFIAISAPHQQGADEFLEQRRTEAMRAHSLRMRERIQGEIQGSSMLSDTIIGMGMGALVLVMSLFVRSGR